MLIHWKSVLRTFIPFEICMLMNVEISSCVFLLSKVDGIFAVISSDSHSVMCVF
jgi:hypothetical protein